MGIGGLVGRIISVIVYISQVLLVSDLISKVGVGIICSCQMGFMKGQGNDMVVMEFFDNFFNIKVGDVVFIFVYS